MPKSVFISYSHQQAEWIVDRLVPVLRAGGAQVLIDQEEFSAGRALLGQMDEVQDKANVQLLVLSPSYLESAYCLHEMRRAVAKDPHFAAGVVIPVIRIDVALPDPFGNSNPLWVNLVDDRSDGPWNQVLEGCDAHLGTSVVNWLRVRNEVRKLTKRGISVSLLTGPGVAWRHLIQDLNRGSTARYAIVDLEKPATASRRGLVGEILRAFGAGTEVPREPEDLQVLERFLETKPKRMLALTHFDLAAQRKTYGVDFFAGLRYLVMESRKLVLLVQSRQPFSALLPADHPLSEIELQQLELPSC